MSEPVRRVLRLVLLGIVVITGVLFFYQQQQNDAANDEYEDARELALTTAVPAATTEPTPTPEVKKQWVPVVPEDDAEMEDLQRIRLDTLRQANPDVVGWIRIPDTSIDYPILQGEDNDFYLNHTWRGKPNRVGSIFLEHRTSPDFADFNTIVYGHNMLDGAMFSDLRKYEQEEFFREHPYVYIVTDEGIFRYDVFSTYRAALDDVTYGLSFRQYETRVEFLTFLMDATVVTPDFEPLVTDRILTLSTCTGAGTIGHRWVVHARLSMEKIAVEE